MNLAKTYSIPIRCVHFTASVKLCEHNDTVRALNLGQEVGFSALAASPSMSSIYLPDAIASARGSLASVNGIVENRPRSSIGVGLRTIDTITNCLQTNPENRTMLPKLAFTSFASKFSAPKLEEGLKEIVTVDFEVCSVRQQSICPSRQLAL